MRTIKVDDEIFAYLQKRARPFIDEPNDVLRRELLERSAQPTADDAGVGSSRRPGALAKMVEAGLIGEGDRLTYTQVRLRRTHHAVVTADGWIVVDGLAEKPFDKPSPALKACVGHEINGWNWEHEPTGTPLYELRDQVDASS